MSGKYALSMLALLSFATLVRAEVDQPPSSPVPPIRDDQAEYLPQLQGGDEGIVEPLDLASTSIKVYDAPGGDDAGAELVDVYPRGTRVRAGNEQRLAGVTWVSVIPLEPGLDPGWIVAEDFSREPIAGTGAALLVPEPGLRPGLPPAQLWLKLGTGRLREKSGGGTLKQSYQDYGFRWGLGAAVYPRGPLRLSLAFDHLYDKGTPVGEYLSGDSLRTDHPQDLEARMDEIALLAGTSHSLGRGRLMLHWGVGPALVHVKETAQIDYTVHESGELVVLGSRQDLRDAWRLGAEAQLGTSFALNPDFQLGLDLGLSYVNWESKQKQSLVLDQLQDDGFLMFSAGLTLSYDLSR